MQVSFNKEAQAKFNVDQSLNIKNSKDASFHNDDPSRPDIVIDQKKTAAMKLGPALLLIPSINPDINTYPEIFLTCLTISLVAWTRTTK